MACTFTAVRPTSLITDHYAVECELLQSKPDRLKRHVMYRKYSAINNSSFAADLELFNISADEEDPVALLAGYDTCLRTIVDAHAPLVSWTITVRPMTPWHTNDLTEEKRTLRRADRLWRKSGLTVHRQIFTDRRNTLRTSLKTACSEYYRYEISKAGGNMRLIYNIADSLLGRKVNRPLPEVADESHSALATRFQRSFKEKIESLCHNRSPLPAHDMPRVVSTRFDVFEPAPLSDVEKIVLASATKSCELDPLPTSLVKHPIDALSPLLAQIINASLSSTVFPAPMKHAVVVPALKKGGSDASVLTNYRPISNITFVAKITERFVAQQLQHFMEENRIYSICQSAYRAHHSVETALVRIHNDIAQSIDSRRSVLLVLLDLSAAFDTINHNTLLRRLSGYVLSGDVLAWLTSYLCNRTCVVRVKSGVSEVETITTGVPQGTVLGPLLFNAYIAPLTTLLQKHNIHHHLYADDTQLYITFPPTDHTQALARMEACVQDVKAWLCDNGLVMNDNKSQAIVIRSSSLRMPTSLTRVNICGQFVDTSPVIRDLGFTIDSNLTMTSQVSSVCRSAYYHLSRIAKIRDSVSTTVCKSLIHIHGLVTSRIDYGNAILFGISDRHLHCLEMVQRSAARIVMQIRRSMTTILRQLHWLPVRKRIEYKLLVLVHRALYDGTQSISRHYYSSTRLADRCALQAGYSSKCQK